MKAEQTLASSTVIDGLQHGKRRSQWGIWPTLGRKPLGIFGGAVVAGMVIMALTAPSVAPYDPYLMHANQRLVPPGREYLLGTDNMGRDILSRIVFGSQISLGVSGMAVALGTSLGAVVGLLSGFFSGRVDGVLQRAIDVTMAFPALVLAMAVVAVLGPSSINVAIAIGVVLIPTTARVIRSAVLSVKSNLYVDAARAIGCRDSRILIKHIVPNVVAPYIVLATVGLGHAVISEASLSFLGLGVPPPAASWGGMLAGGGRAYTEVAPWVGIFPGLAICLTVLGFNLMGDALRDLLDPKQRRA